jgi:site-specific recombinase XerC
VGAGAYQEVRSEVQETLVVAGILAGEEEALRPSAISRTPMPSTTPAPSHPSQRLPRYLSQDEVAGFFGVIAESRDRALFAVMYHYGLRVSEIGLLARTDVDLVRHRIIVKRVKSGLWTERPLFSRTEELLREHLDKLDAATSELFPGRSGPLQKRQIQSLFCRYRAAAGLARHFTCHGLRHSIATHLLDAGLSLEFVQDHLGHRSIRSTSIYARITDRHRAALFEQLEQSPWIVQPRGRL